jgi:hypothetical protein
LSMNEKQAESGKDSNADEHTWNEPEGRVS